MKKQRNSSSLTKAERRADGSRSIDPNLNMGRGFSVPEYDARIQEVRAKLAAYNVARTQADATFHALQEAERELNNYSAHFLLSVASHYGKESDEYEMAGGTRKVSRRKLRSVNNSPANPDETIDQA